MLCRSTLGGGNKGGGGGDIQAIVATILKMESEHSDKLFQIQMQQRESQDREINHLRQQMERLVDKVSTPPAATPGGGGEKPKSLKEQLSELKEMKDVIRDALGIEEDNGKSGGAGWVEHLPLILQAGTVLVGSMASILHNLAVVQGKGGAPIAPPPVDAALSPEQKSALDGMNGGAGQSVRQPPPQQTTPAQPQTEQENAMVRAHQFFAMITTPLLRTFNAGEGGADFAARLVELTEDGFFGPGASGTQVYDQVLEFGQPVIATLIKTYPPIWNVVGQTPAKWDRFLNDFFNARQIWAQEEIGRASCRERV